MMKKNMIIDSPDPSYDFKEFLRRVYTPYAWDEDIAKIFNTVNATQGLYDGYIDGARSDKEAQEMEQKLNLFISLPGDIFDVGCRCGGLLIELLLRRKDIRGLGIDISNIAIEKAWMTAKANGLITEDPKSPGRAAFYHLPAESLAWRSILPNLQFKGAIVSEILEYVRRPLEVFSGLKRRMPPGGQIIIKMLAEKDSIELRHFTEKRLRYFLKDYFINIERINYKPKLGRRQIVMSCEIGEKEENVASENNEPPKD